MISIHVRVSELDDKFVWLGVGEVRDHVCEESVGGDVEGDAETEVGGALIHKA